VNLSNKTEKISMGNYRFERKFQILDLNTVEVELYVKIHPAMFSEIYHQRFVNSIYLDSIDRQSYIDNIVGISKRKKTRVRWYGDLYGTVEEPILEIKKKIGFVNTKESFPLSPLKIGETESHQDIWDKLILSTNSDLIKSKISLLEVVLFVRYSRKYFLSACGKFRITIDSDVTFFNFSGRHHIFDQKSAEPKSRIVMELKYPQEHDLYAKKIANHFPFRITRSSKYVAGVESF
jgi:hypothetical protein